MQDTFDDVEEISPADVSPELSKHFRGMRMWLSLRVFGLHAFKAALSEKIWLTRYFYKQLENEPGFEMGPFPQLSVAFFRYMPKTASPNEFNQKLVEEVKKDGRIFLSSTTLNGNFYIRIAVLCFRTHLNTINICLEVLKNGVKHLEGNNKL
jgi:glutamate/tyrosine decarboxylase-like PLP-dependent enzyme